MAKFDTGAIDALKLTSNAHFSLAMSKKATFQLNFGQIHDVPISGAEVYAGVYNVEPNFEQQTLRTQNKLMRNDITVNPIAIASVSNNAGGKTVYIGGTING